MMNKTSIRRITALVLAGMMILSCTGCSRIQQLFHLSVNPDASANETQGPSDAVTTAEPAEDADYLVGPGSTLRVLDRNGDPYADYAYQIVGSPSNPSELENREALTEEPLPLPEQEGLYKVTLTDQNDSSQPISFTVKVELEKEAQQLVIPTNYLTPEPVPEEWLFAHWFEAGTQEPRAFRFYPDGVVECYSLEALRDESYLRLAGTDSALYYTQSGSYQLRGNKLEVQMGAEGELSGFSFTVSYLQKSQHPERSDWGAAEQIPGDEWFFYEMGVGQGADNASDDGAYCLTVQDSHEKALVFGGDMDNSVSIDDAVLVSDAYSATESFPGSGTEKFEYHIPKINLESEEIDLLNQSIYDDLYALCADAASKIPDRNEDFYYNLIYSYARNGDILSLWDNYNYYFYYDEEWDVYNVSISQKRSITKQELIAACGLSEEAYLEKVKQAMASRFLDAFSSAAGDAFFLTQLQKTVDDANIDEARPFLNEKGELCVVARVYSMAGGDSYLHIINLDSFTLSPLYKQYMGSDAPRLEEPYASFLYLQSYSADDYMHDVESYCLFDIDKDGTDELLLSGEATYLMLMVYAIDPSSETLKLAGIFDSFTAIYYSPSNRAIVTDWRYLDNMRPNYIYTVSQLKGTEMETLRQFTYSVEDDTYTDEETFEQISEQTAGKYLDDRVVLEFFPIMND